MNFDVSYKLKSINEFELKYNTHLAQAFEVVAYDLFKQALPVPGNNPLVVEGYVLGDGQGDYAHMQNVKKALHKKFPDRTICSYIISSTNHQGKFSPSTKPCYEDHIAYFGQSSATPPNIANSPFDESLEKTIEKIKSADVWFSGPISNGGLFDSLKNEAEKKKIVVGEYNALVNFSETDFKARMQMGIGSVFLIVCDGIATMEAKKDYTYSSLANKGLKEILFGSSEPSDEMISQYLAANAMFFYYSSSGHDLPKFVRRANAFGQHIAPDKNIDIIFPKNASYIDGIKSSASDLNRLLPGIKAIKEISFKDGKSEEKTLKIADEGVDLRVIHPGVLSSKDFKICVHLSSPLVGCTGNTSVSQALSFGKIPQYQGFLGHTRDFNYHLISYIKKLFGDDSPLAKFMELSEDQDHDKAIQYLKDPRIIQQAQELAKNLKEQYAIEPVIQGMANEILCRQKYPEFAKKEDELKQKYLDGKVTLQEVHNTLREELKTLNLLS